MLSTTFLIALAFASGAVDEGAVTLGMVSGDANIADPTVSTAAVELRRPAVELRRPVVDLRRPDVQPADDATTDALSSEYDDADEDSSSSGQPDVNAAALAVFAQLAAALAGGRPSIPLQQPRQQAAATPEQLRGMGQIIRYLLAVEEQASGVYNDGDADAAYGMYLRAAVSASGALSNIGEPEAAEIMQQVADRAQETADATSTSKAAWYLRMQLDAFIQRVAKSRAYAPLFQLRPGQQQQQHAEQPQQQQQPSMIDRATRREGRPSPCIAGKVLLKEVFAIKDGVVTGGDREYLQFRDGCGDSDFQQRVKEHVTADRVGESEYRLSGGEHHGDKHHHGHHDEHGEHHYHHDGGFGGDDEAPARYSWHGRPSARSHCAGFVLFLLSLCCCCACLARRKRRQCELRRAAGLSCQRQFAAPADAFAKQPPTPAPTAEYPPRVPAFQRV